MASIPRLVVVDPRHEIARIVRGATALLARQVVLVDVPDAAEALDEIERVQVDLLVTAATLPGEIDGLELADQVSHMSLATPVIVLASQDDPRPDPARVEQAPFQYFVRPVAEPFLRGVRIALDGLAAVGSAEAPAAPEAPMADIPPVDVKALRALMLPLMRDVGAMGVILADRLGRVLVDEGATGYLDRERLAALLGPSFGRTGQVAELVGGRPWAMQYFDGERIDVYALSLGLHYFLCMLFEGSNRAAMGAVAVYGRRAADRMVDLMGEAAFATPQIAPVTPEPAPAEAAAPVAPADHAARAEEDEWPPFEPLPDEAFDPDTLFAQRVDEALADSLFDPEALSELAASFDEDDGDRVDLDAARDLGLIGD